MILFWTRSKEVFELNWIYFGGRNSTRSGWTRKSLLNQLVLQKVHCWRLLLITLRKNSSQCLFTKAKEIQSSQTELSNTQRILKSATTDNDLPTRPYLRKKFAEVAASQSYLTPPIYVKTKKRILKTFYNTKEPFKSRTGVWLALGASVQWEVSLTGKNIKQI